MASQWAKRYVSHMPRLPKTKAELAEVVTAAQMSALEAQRNEISAALEVVGPAFDTAQANLMMFYGEVAK